jgi:hypothetical protein
MRRNRAIQVGAIDLNRPRFVPGTEIKGIDLAGGSANRRRVFPALVD